MKPDQISPRALAVKDLAGRSGVALGNTDRDITGVTIAVGRNREAVQVSTRPEHETAIAKQIAVRIGIALPLVPGDVAREGSLSGYRLAPGKWRIAGKPETPGSLASNVVAALDGKPAYATDIGQQLAIFRISGPDVRRLLAKGSAVDFHPAHFPPDSGAQTAWAGCHVLIDCKAGDCFEIQASRSQAVHLLEALSEAALEYRLTHDDG